MSVAEIAAISPLEKRRAKGKRPPALVAVAGVIIAIVALLAVFGLWIVPHDPGLQDLTVGVSGISAENLAGTDTLGRDIFSRVIFGAPTALVGPVIVAVSAFTCATVLGLLAGYLGGWVDTLIMRWCDFMFALPGTLIIIIIVGVVGGGYWTAVAVLTFFFIAPDTRIVRSAVLEQRPLPYVDAARTLGVSKARILFVHILPNVLPIILAYVVLDFAFALVNLAGLSFLGLGVEPGTPDWGRMLFENRNILFSNPVALLLPAAMIILTAVSMNLIGDWLFGRLTK
jgi:peptide/nickel transport system permease protein